MSDSEQPSAELGISTGQIEIRSREELARLSLQLAAQASRRLDIVSRHLDSDLYDNNLFCEAVKRLALSHRNARIRLLIIDSKPLKTRSHRLLELAARLTSFIAIYGPGAQHRDFNEAFLLADDAGYIQRRFGDRFEGNADFNDRRTTLALRERMDDMWERGSPDLSFRRLHI